MKAIWSGSISFGLLNIPVQLYSGIAEHKFGFNILCGKCHNRLKNIRWCEHCAKEVAWDDTVRGFKKSDGSFFIMTEEAIQQLKPETIDTINIKEFVDKDEVEILYISDHYYMMPHKAKDKAFYLFACALKKSKKVAIGQFVMREKEYIVAISFYKNVLLLNTLHYHYEIRTVPLEGLESVKITKEELDLALLLINKLTHKKLVLSNYKDTFIEKLKKALSQKNRSKKGIKKLSKKTKAKKESLTASLQESVRSAARR